MATSEHGRQRGPEGPALSRASQTAAALGIDSIHMSIEAEQKWVSPHVEEKLKSRLTCLTLPGGGGKTTPPGSIPSRIIMIRRSGVQLVRGDRVCLEPDQDSAGEVDSWS